MNLSVPRRGSLLQRGHHHVDESWVPIGGFPQHGVEQDGYAQDHDVLNPHEEKYRAKEPNHRIHDGQAEKLGRAHEAEEEWRALSHRQRLQQLW